MKKATLLVSMLTVAAAAMAYDAPQAGNYYLIQANRGVPYLSYQAEAFENGTNLYRAESPATNSVWQVSAGNAEGSLVIKNYTTNAYLMGFTFQGEESTVIGSLANTVAAPADIFTKQMTNGAYALSLNSADGGSQEDDDLYTLDATGGNSIYCGNWLPDEGGACWWFTLIDVKEGQTMEDALAAVAMKPMVEEAVAELNTYIAAVPGVADVLTAAVGKLEALELNAANLDKVAEIKAAAINDANAALPAWMASKPFALESVRRSAIGSEGGAFICYTEGSEKFGVTANMLEPGAAWTFKAVTGGVIAYNKEANAYVGEGQAPVADEADAQVVNPILLTAGDYVGISLPIVGNETNQGWNVNSYAGGTLTQWSYADGGSIWSLVEPSSEYMMGQYADAAAAEFAGYIAALPNVAAPLNAAVEKIKGLAYSDDVADEVAEIKDEAFDAANQLLANELSGKTLAIKYLRGDDFISLGTPEDSEDEDEVIFTHAATVAEAATFTFIPAADGGFYIYNAANNAYVGIPESYTYVGENPNANVILPAASKEAASIVTPRLGKGGNFYGIAFWLNDEGAGINMNSSDNLKSYSVNDGGSIFNVVDPNATGNICAPITVKTAAGIFDLQGRRLSAPRQGINIIDGRKVIIK